MVVRTSLSPTFSSTSPARTSARWAGPPRVTSVTTTLPSRSATSRPSQGAFPLATKLVLCSSCRWNSVRTMSIGIANPMFSAPADIALLMPTRRPVMSSSAPPLFPWLIAASVCRRSSYSRTTPSGARTWIDRPVADSTPLVTVLAWPWGLPIAMTVSPIMRSDERPISIGCTRSSPSSATCRRARSRVGDELSTRALRSRPSRSLTSTL